jgi:L-threonylcarbamoyladenylate synthase
LIPEKIHTQRLPARHPASIETAAAFLRSGQPVAFPTDTVYGVGVDPFDEAAISRLFTIKQRALDKGIPVLLADLADLDRIAAQVPPSAVDLIERFWPGPLTIIVPRHSSLPDVIAPQQTVAVRIPDHDLARALIRAAGGAVAASSANRSGQPSATSGEEALGYLDGLVAAVLDDGPSPGDAASTIVDCTSIRLRLLRAGPLTAAEIGIEPEGAA